jgi:deoxyribose-phosphate aldolase
MASEFDLNSRKAVARLIDHTILRASATEMEVCKVVEEALQFQTASVCVNPIWVGRVAQLLQGSEVRACSVVGFPLGASRPQTIAYEASLAVNDGATEIDMVMDIGRAKSGEWNHVSRAIRMVREAVSGSILKVILEICELSDDEIKSASSIAIGAGADFIKTSTGFGKSGATVDAVRIMASVANGSVGIKAAGGIRTLHDLTSMIEAGATRIGASSTVSILNAIAE